MQKKIKRTCEQCGEEKRTTLDLMEMPIYDCEDCQKAAGLPVLQNGVKSGVKIVLITAIIFFIIGYLVRIMVSG